MGPLPLSSQLGSLLAKLSLFLLTHLPPLSCCLPFLLPWSFLFLLCPVASLVLVLCPRVAGILRAAISPSFTDPERLSDLLAQWSCSWFYLVLPFRFYGRLVSTVYEWGKLLIQDLHTPCPKEHPTPQMFRILSSRSRSDSGLPAAHSGAPVPGSPVARPFTLMLPLPRPSLFLPLAPAASALPLCLTARVAAFPVRRRRRSRSPVRSSSVHPQDQPVGPGLSRLFCPVASCPDHAHPSHGWLSFQTMRPHVEAHLSASSWVIFLLIGSKATGSAHARSVIVSSVCGSMGAAPRAFIR